MVSSSGVRYFLVKGRLYMRVGGSKDDPTCLEIKLIDERKLDPHGTSQKQFFILVIGMPRSVSTPIIYWWRKSIVFNRWTLVNNNAMSRSVILSPIMSCLLISSTNQKAYFNVR